MKINYNLTIFAHAKKLLIYLIMNMRFSSRDAQHYTDVCEYYGFDTLYYLTTKVQLGSRIFNTAQGIADYLSMHTKAIKNSVMIGKNGQ